jgi:hypothetical protein
MRLGGATAAAVLLAACGGHAGPSAGSTANETATQVKAATYGVLVKDFPIGQNGYQVEVVGPDGRLVATARGQNRGFTGGLPDLPVVSSSNRYVYYLDGDSDVRYLALSGKTGLAYRIPLSTTQIASFAVSQDDTRIAYTVIDYFSRQPTPQQPQMRLFVDRLSGGNRVDLFDSTSLFEWPSGWNQSRLVLSVAAGAFAQNAGPFFMTANSFHVVDSATGNRLLVLCDDQPAVSSLGRYGTVCGSDVLNGGVYKPTAYIERWDGTKHPIPQNNGTCLQAGLLAPDGSLMATHSTRVTPDGSCSYDYDATVRLISTDGRFTDSQVQGSPMGWMDSNHLLVQEILPAFSSPGAQARVRVLDLKSNTAVPVAGSGFFVGDLPGGLDI